MTLVSLVMLSTVWLKILCHDCYWAQFLYADANCCTAVTVAVVLNQGWCGVHFIQTLSFTVPLLTVSSVSLSLRQSECNWELLVQSLPFYIYQLCAVHIFFFLLYFYFIKFIKLYIITGLYFQSKKLHCCRSCIPPLQSQFLLCG